jgi:hypothetical protein
MDAACHTQPARLGILRTTCRGATTTQFVEFHGMEGLREPSGAAALPVTGVEAPVTGAEDVSAETS